MDGLRDAGPDQAFPIVLAGDRPKGAALREVLDRLIKALGPGSMLPSERMLAERYGLARTTVRQVIDELVREGRAYRLQGSGTFVRGDQANASPAVLSFAEDMYARGMEPHAEMLSSALVAATELVALHLEVAASTEILCVESLLSADGEPMAIQRRYLPVGHNNEPANGSAGPSAAEHHAPYEHVEQWAAAVRLGNDESRVLDATTDEPGLLVQRVLRDARKAVVEYARTTYRGDRYELHSRHVGD